MFYHLKHLIRDWGLHLGGFLFSYLASIREIPVSSLPAWAAPLAEKIFQFSSNNSGTLYIVALIATASSFLARILLPDSRTEQFVLDYLTETRNNVISKPVLLAQKGEHHHRVTLFQYKKCYLSWRAFRRCNGSLCHPFSGWLIGVKRTGHTALGIRTRFPATALGDSDGVVGHTWACNLVTYKGRLAPITQTSDRAMIQKYAAETNVTEDWVRKRMAGRNRPMYASLCGVPVTVSGKIWGVVVVDSTEPGAIVAPGTPEGSILYGQLQTVLGKLLERW